MTPSPPFHTVPFGRKNACIRSPHLKEWGIIEIIKTVNQIFSLLWFKPCDNISCLGNKADPPQPWVAWPCAPHLVPAICPPSPHSSHTSLCLFLKHANFVPTCPLRKAPPSACSPFPPVLSGSAPSPHAGLSQLTCHLPWGIQDKSWGKP